MSTEPVSPAACLALLLDGPLQSWGAESRFTRRTTRAFPTRSAIIGLLAAAQGIDKYGPGEPEALARFADLRLTILRLPKGNLLMRRLQDYHTIGGGYEKGADRMKKPRAASGAGLDTILSERHYLLDTRFGVLLEGGASQLDAIAQALRNPRWGLWLGRKCCIPARPLLAGQAAGRDAALRLVLERAGYSPEISITHFDHLIEGPEAEGSDAEWINDAPLGYGRAIGERHAPRRVRLVPRIEPETAPARAPADVMADLLLGSEGED